jgi:hypothetical protein
MAGELVAILCVGVWERDLEDRKHVFECSYPDGWVQALKKALGLKYRKHYVREEVKFKVAERYPGATIKLPEDKFGKAVMYSRLCSTGKEEYT